MLIRLAMTPGEPGTLQCWSAGVDAAASGREEGFPTMHARFSSAVSDRITIGLVEKASADLQSMHERTHMSKTDIVNRAVSFYEFVESELSEGAQLIIRRNGQDYLVELL